MERTTALLMQMLEANKDTVYGKKYGFADIHSIEDSALLYRPYSDEPDNSGSLMLSVEEMEKVVIKFTHFA